MFKFWHVALHEGIGVVVSTTLVGYNKVSGPCKLRVFRKFIYLICQLETLGVYIFQYRGFQWQM